MRLIKEVYESWGAEVVFITSNWQGNKEMMEGCKEAGIPAFVSGSPDIIPTFVDLSSATIGHTLGLLMHFFVAILFLSCYISFGFCIMLH